MSLSTKVISGENYLAIATYYANAKNSNWNSVDYLFDAVYSVVLLNEIYPTADLFNEIWNSYLVNADIYRSTSSYLPAVRVLNDHILNRAGSDVSDINDYLDITNIQVPMAWAELCKSTGVLICVGNISDPNAVSGDGFRYFADGVTKIPAC